MSIIGMPSLAMLLVLTNFALCLSVDPQSHAADVRRPATEAESPPSLRGLPRINGLHRPADRSMPARLRIRTD